MQQPETANHHRPHMAMLVGNRVVGDSRVEKAAVSAMRAGYRVTIVGNTHRSTFQLGRYGAVPILRVPLLATRHRAWLQLHFPGALEGTDWAASLPAEEAEHMAAASADDRPVPGLAQALVRGAAPHTAPDAVRGRLLSTARNVEAGIARLPAPPLPGAPRAVTGRLRRGVENFRATRHQGWRRTWPLIADYEDVFLRALVELEPDIIHVHDRHPLPAADAYARWRRARGLTPVPWIYDAHEWLPGQALPGPVQQRTAWKAAEAELIHNADAVLSVTDDLARRLQDHHGLPELPGTVVNAPWSSRAPLDPRTRGTIRQECGLADDVPLLVYLGKIAEVRGVRTVVQALPLLPGVHAAFVVSADEGPRAALRTEAEDLGVGDRVHLLDYVPSASVTWYVESATLGLSPLLPTPAHESALATKLREYIQAGLPLVVSDLQAQAEFVLGQGVGTVHAPDDAADLARAVRDALAQLESLRATVARPEVQDAHRWEAAERVLHQVWTRLAPVSAEPLPSVISPDSLERSTPMALTVVGDSSGGSAVAQAWREAGAPARVRAAVPAPEDPHLLAGGPAALEEVLTEWLRDDDEAAAVLYTGQGPAAGRAEGTLAAEAASLLAHGRGVGLLLGDVPLTDPRLRRRAVPDHPWRELDDEAFGKIERHLRRARRPFTETLPAGAVRITHDRVDAALDPDLRWLPRPVSEAATRPASGPRSVLIVPGDRTAAEREAVAALQERLTGHGVPVETPSARRFRLRGPGAWPTDVVVDLLHLGGPSAAAEHAWAAGSTVVGGPALFEGTVGGLTPVVVTDESGLTDVVLGLLGEDDARWRERTAQAREHHAAVHAPAAVGRRLQELLRPEQAE